MQFLTLVSSTRRSVRGSQTLLRGILAVVLQTESNGLVDDDQACVSGRAVMTWFRQPEGWRDAVNDAAHVSDSA